MLDLLQHEQNFFSLIRNHSDKRFQLYSITLFFKMKPHCVLQTVFLFLLDSETIGAEVLSDPTSIKRSINHFLQQQIPKCIILIVRHTHTVRIMLAQPGRHD